jgi:hypothetical protein
VGVSGTCETVFMSLSVECLWEKENGVVAIRRRRYLRNESIADPDRCLHSPYIERLVLLLLGCEPTSEDLITTLRTFLSEVGVLIGIDQFKG